MSDSDDCYGPPLPPDMSSAGASKKPSQHGAQDGSSSDSSSDSNSDSDSNGPSPSKIPKKVRPQIGPHIPQHIKPSTDNPEFIGPIVPSGFTTQHPESESEDEAIGPRPFSGNPDDLAATAAQEFEQRAQKMKHKMLHEDDEPEVTGRETWMTELPPEMTKNFGLGPRQFSKNSGRPKVDSDRSVWTDTPADRERKAKDAAEGRGAKRKHADIVPTERDRLFSGQVQEYNKSERPESLLDMHRKKLEKEKKKADKKAEKKAKKKEKKERKRRKKDKEKDKKKSKPAKLERRPFDREQDLQVNRLDDARRKAIIKKSAELNTKFGRGSQQFL